MDSKSNHQHDTVSSPSLTGETIVRTLTSLSPPTLPFDLIPEILCRLPVKLLVQFRCVCKSWNSLISDPKFAKKHLRLSTVSLVHTLTYSFDKYVLKSYPLDSVFADVTANPIAQLEFHLNHDVYLVGSCNGILCFLAKDYNGFRSFRLLNPSIRKFRETPPLQKLQTHYPQLYSFIHDHITDNYKVVVVLRVHDSSRNFVDKHEVKVHTLGTDSWKSIQTFPFDCVALQCFGQCVSGTINWLVAKMYDNKIQHCIVSLDLGNESYKEVLMPPGYRAINIGYLNLQMSVLRDCLCVAFGHDVWVMKEYGNKESWNKLYNVSYMGNQSLHAYTKTLYIYEDDQMLMSFNGMFGDFGLYNSKTSTLKIPEIQYIGCCMDVYVESLISPC